jgi:hypothetical protein
VTNGAVYAEGEQPQPQCLTTDTYSGVRFNAGTVITGGRADGTGVVTVKCSDGTDQAGNEAATMSAKYQIVYAFGGFMAPAVGSTIKQSVHNISVRFVLTNVSDTPIAASTAAALASTFDVRATLRGPGISATSASCAWQPHSASFNCVIVRPRTVRTGHSNPYTITVTENLGGGFVTVPIDFISQNPAPVYFAG